MFHSENIAIFAILLRYFDIPGIGFVMLFGYCISVLERYCTSAVYTYILPSPNLWDTILWQAHSNDLTMRCMVGSLSVTLTARGVFNTPDPQIYLRLMVGIQASLRLNITNYKCYYSTRTSLP